MTVQERWDITILLILGALLGTALVAVVEFFDPSGPAFLVGGLTVFLGSGYVVGAVLSVRGAWRRRREQKRREARVPRARVVEEKGR